MIGDEHGFPKESLTGSMFQRSEEIGGRIANEVTHCIEVGQNLRRRPLPIVLGRFRCWPIVVREGHFLLAGINAEIENVPLSEADMLQQLPWRARRTDRRIVDTLKWKTVQCGGYVNMGRTSVEQFDEMIAKRGDLAFVHY